MCPSMAMLPPRCIARSAGTLAAVAMLAVSLFVAAPASAAGSSQNVSSALGATALVLTVAPADVGLGVDLENVQLPKVAVLVCDPAAGTHPDASAACDAIATANGDFNALPSEPDAICTMIYAPATATATGLWHGRSVNFEKTYSNACLMQAETGPVFSF